jgi:hypothetical protein
MEARSRPLVGGANLTVKVAEECAGTRSVGDKNSTAAETLTRAGGMKKLGAPVLKYEQGRFVSVSSS